MLEDTLTINYEGKPKDLFMSFGLLNDLLKIIHDIPNVQIIAMDAGLRAEVLEAVFATRDTKGAITETTPVSALPLSKTDAHRVLEWVGAHALDFFLEALERAVKLMEPHHERLVKSMPSGAGSEA